MSRESKAASSFADFAKAAEVAGEDIIVIDSTTPREGEVLAVADDPAGPLYWRPGSYELRWARSPAVRGMRPAPKRTTSPHTRPRAREVRPRQRRVAGGSRDRPRPSADDDPEPARRALARLDVVPCPEAVA